MQHVRIWLNRNYATAVHLLDMLRHNPDGVPVELFGSHADLSSPMLAGVDHKLREPVVTDPDFVDQMLDLCRQHRIDVLLPVAGQSQIAHRASDFASIGTALICPPADAVDLLADKADTYQALAGSKLVPPWRVARSGPQFDAAIVDLDELWTRSHPLIMKPTRGVGADGVRFLTRAAPDLTSLLGPIGPLVWVQTVRDAIAAAAEHVPDLMLMPYLPGPETSVDVLAHRGRTLAAIPRTKSGRHRVLGGDPRLPGLASELVERFDLDGLVNVQFRLFNDEPALLEINSRPSGGLFQTALTGVNLPWAAVQLALGRDPGPLHPRLGTEFVSVSSVVPLTQVAAGVASSFAGTKPLEVAAAD
ncbi:ATP-grasp domain-containing protein [Nakamurella panacisegetis]|uniref:ATP-grasp domain-containing protein n=1 Tax=Nakamurella panacisegetis TaxID=1090615 RepID=A0A1H0L6C0_9ACTN|nr:ATP-grasp domain-containing protein [Nakamurella panacisegetis]SDO63510.1 ATP-grasp domain-containing protein [Nakamurella panacisegetis]